MIQICDYLTVNNRPLFIPMLGICYHALLRCLIQTVNFMGYLTESHLCELKL